MRSLWDGAGQVGCVGGQGARKELWEDPGVEPPLPVGGCAKLGKFPGVWEPASSPVTSSRWEASRPGPYTEMSKTNMVHALMEIIVAESGNK